MYKINTIFLIVAYLTYTESVFLVNCPTNYYWNTQYHTCVQQSYCNSGIFGLSNQQCVTNYNAPIMYQDYNVPTTYSTCQTTMCPCYQTACQHNKQICYAQVPCIYYNHTIIPTTTSAPITTTTSAPITTTTSAPITTTTSGPITTTTSAPVTTPTTTPTPCGTDCEFIENITTPLPCPHPCKTRELDDDCQNEIDIKLVNTIISNNHIYTPVYVSNINQVKSDVHTNRIVRETTTKSQESETTTTTIRPTTERQPKPDNKTSNCCIVYSPRMCEYGYDDNWDCYHSKYRRCGGFCYRENIYLRPRQIEYRPPILIMPPPRWSIKTNYININYQANIDCSGCIYGEYHCSSECYIYNCNTNRCGYIDQDYFCKQYGGSGCYEDDGYFNDYYYY